MISALLFLQFNSLRNRLQARFKRLKHPKYLVGAVIGGVYLVFYFSFLIRHVGLGQAGTAGSFLPANTLSAESLGAIILFVVVVLGWVLPNSRAALAFTEAEIAFLFPAPITRRGLIHYKLIRSQFGILFSTLFLTLLRGRWQNGGSHLWISLFGWWLILSTLNLHLIAGSFVRTMLFDRGITNWKRRVIILGGLAAVIGGVVAWSWNTWPTPPSADADFKDVLGWFQQVLTTGATPYVLYPFRLVVAPYNAPGALAFFEALGPALVIMALHYAFVVRADVAFEEASVEYSAKLATRLATMRERRVSGGFAPTKAKRAPFKLPPTGLPSVAFLWKNLILAGSIFSPRTFIRLGIFLVIMVAVIHPGQGDSAGPSVIGLFCIGLLMLSLFAGQNLLRIDFRADLNMADQLKLYPLPGWQIVLGEILAPVAILVAVQWLCILGAALFIALPNHPIVLTLKVVCALGAALLVPAIDLIMLIVPNAVALLLPSWVRFDKNAPRGFEMIGQNIILSIGQVLVLLLAVLPAGLVFWLVLAVAGLALGPALAVFPAALAAAAMLAAEGAGAIYLLGKAFENFDLSAEQTM